MAFISKVYILLVQEKVGKFRVSGKLEIKANILGAKENILKSSFSSFHFVETAAGTARNGVASLSLAML